MRGKPVRQGGAVGFVALFWWGLWHSIRSHRKCQWFDSIPKNLHSFLFHKSFFNTNEMSRS